MTELRIEPREIKGCVVRPATIPDHTAIIMDGNGRWAQRRGLMRWRGHLAARNRQNELIRSVAKSGTRILTLYCFSTENWKRSDDEVSTLFDIFLRTLLAHTDEFDDLGACLQVLGDITRLPKVVQDVAKESVDRLKSNDRFLLNLCISYGGRNEIIQATKQLAKECAEGRLDPSHINEKLFETRLSTSGLPDPDLVIRTSGEKRISNFLLWQIAYSELYITDTLWPDFGPEEYRRACEDFACRNRRFGADKEMRPEPSPCL